MTSGKNHRGEASDFRVNSLILRLTPARYRAYALLARLDRPIGAWLLLLPGWWSLALAGSRHWAVYLAFGAGAILMRGCGCTVNDMIDRHIDRQVARTASRPLASGLLSLRQAAGFAVLQLACAAAIVLTLGRMTVIIAVASLAIIVTYPLMKRITWWPQFFLGLAFNIGALMGWTAAGRELSVIPVVLYLAGICWTLGYDTIYALQDRSDDAIVGVKSTARLFGANVRRWVAGFYGMSIALLAVALALNESGWPAWLGLAAMGLLLVWQGVRLAPLEEASFGRLFRANAPAGLCLFAGLVLDLAGRA